MNQYAKTIPLKLHFYIFLGVSNWKKVLFFKKFAAATLQAHLIRSSRNTSH